jgi:hypothetical protein
MWEAIALEKIFKATTDKTKREDFQYIKAMWRLILPLRGWRNIYDPVALCCDHLQGHAQNYEWEGRKSWISIPREYVPSLWFRMVENVPHMDYHIVDKLFRTYRPV